MVAVPYGAPAAAAFHEQVAAAKADDPLAPVTVVVPSNYVGVAARRRLAYAEAGELTPHGKGVAGVTFLTVYRLAELLAAPALAGEGRRPVSTPVVAAAVRGALADDPGYFGPVARHPATEEALVAAHRELSDLSPAALDALARESERAGEVVRLHRATRDALAEHWYEEPDLLAHASEVVPTAPLAGELGTVIVHLPQQLGRGAAGLLSLVASRSPMVVVAGVTGRPGADRAVRQAVARLGGDPAPLDRASRLGVADDVGLEVVSTADADDEVRAVLRRVVDALGDGVPLDRIAVLYGTREPYARLLHEHLTAAGIPYNGTAVRPVAERLAGRTLLRALGLADDGYRRRDVLALLTGAQVRTADGRFAPTSAWERLSREAGVVRGRDDWDRQLARFVDELGRQADEEEQAAEPMEWLVERHRRNAGLATELRDYVGDLIDRVDPEGLPDTWRSLAEHARELLAHLVGGEQRRQRWPEAERRAADDVEAALDRLGGLDEVAGAPTGDEFRRALREELESDLGRTGRLGEGLAVGALGLGLGLDVDLVVVVGLAEGSLPAHVAEDTLLPDRERQAVGDLLPLAADRVDDDHRRLLAAAACARRRVVLTFPRGDLRRSAERQPSRWLLELAGERSGRVLWSDDLADLDEEWFHQVPSFAGGVARLEFPVTHQEYRLRALDHRRRTDADPTGDAVVAADPQLGRAMALVRQRRSRDFTRFDGNLAGLDIPSPVEKVLGPTRLEIFSGCPHRYLFEQILRVGEVEDPEERLDISPADRGLLVHKALEDFLTEVLDSPDGPPAPDQPWSAERRARLGEIAGALCDDYEGRGLTGRRLLWRQTRRVILADLDQLLDYDDAEREHRRARPAAAELAFGRKGDDVDPVAVELPDGREMRFAGSADRVDHLDGGGLLVTDYKTGSDAAFSKMSEDNPDKEGRKLQLPVYGLAARLQAGRPTADVRARYWFATSRRNFKEVGYDVSDAVVDRFRSVVGEVVEAIEGGVFPARPPASSWSAFSLFRECPFCDPDRLGAADVARAWERKRTAPELARLLALLEPDEGDGRG